MVWLSKQRGQTVETLSIFTKLSSCSKAWGSPCGWGDLGYVWAVKTRTGTDTGNKHHSVEDVTSRLAMLAADRRQQPALQISGAVFPRHVSVS